MKKAAILSLMLPLFSTNAIAGTSYKVYENPPAPVFATTIRVAEKYGSGLAIDREDQIISFTVGSSVVSGTDHLTVFFRGLPDGCGKDKPCTATKVEVKGNRVTVGGLWFKTGRSDVTAFLERLQKELKNAPAPSTSPPVADKS